MFIITTITTTALLCGGCLATYLFCKHRFSFWRRKGLDYLNPTFPFGDIKEVWHGVPPSVQFSNFYKTFKSRGQKHGGVFQFFEPTYVPVDPEYVKDILIEFSQHFTDRGVYKNEKDQPIIRNLFFMEGSDWKNMRVKLSPAYTSGKMKMMFETMLKCSESLVTRIEEAAESREKFDMKDISARYTTDVIGSCAFGIECNSFMFPDSEFRMYGKKMFEDSIYRTVRRIFRMAFPNFCRKLGMLVIEEDVANFFKKAITDTYCFRKRHNIKRKDFMQLLIELKDQEVLSMNDVIAEAFIFFVAGFDTSATTLTFALFELANNCMLRIKLHTEIDDILNKYDGAITYEAVHDMKLLDMVVQETLRKYPPVALINRICTETYKIPHSNVTLEKGTHVGISVLGLHRDPELFPEPRKFNPERFSDKNKGKIVPGSYIPFGDGPRVCIGLRFGLMQVKIGLVTLLKDFDFGLSFETSGRPLKIDYGFVMNVKGGIWLHSRKRNL